MSFINWNILHSDCRDSNYNNCVAISRNELDKAIADDETIFGRLTEFTSELASVRYYPFTLSNAQRGILQTAKLKASIPSIYVYRTDKEFMRNMGELYIVPKFNNFMDYEGYTSYKLWLPMLGFINLPTNEIIHKWLQIRVLIDTVSGQGCYFVGYSSRSLKSDMSEDNLIVGIGTYIFQAGIDIPIGSSNWGDIKRNMLMGTLKTAVNVGSMLYGMTLPPTTTDSTITTRETTKTRGTEKGSRLKVTSDIEGSTTKHTESNVAYDVSRPISTAINGSIDALNFSKPVGSSDRISDIGILWNTSLQPILYRYTPRAKAVTNNYIELKGKPSGYVAKISESKGFTKVSDVHLENVVATSEEIAMIKQALYNGIII